MSAGTADAEPRPSTVTICQLTSTTAPDATVSRGEQGTAAANDDHDFMQVKPGQDPRQDRATDNS
jgi:hypothetical protein